MIRRLLLLLIVAATIAAGCSQTYVDGDAASHNVTTSQNSQSEEAATATGATATTTVVPTVTTTTTVTPTTTTVPPSTTTSPALSTTVTTTTEPPRGRLVISATGDVALDPSYIPALRSNGYEYAFSGLQDVFLHDDLTIINLECAVSDFGDPLPKAFNFRCDPDALPVAAANGVEVANLANNHSGDFGRLALLDSRDNVEDAGIAPVGVGSNKQRANEPALFEINGWTVAVLGFGGVVPDHRWLATDDRPGMASGDATEEMVAAVEAAAEIADLVFVTIHWGSEGKTQPLAEDVMRAEAMIAAGADGIFGHHPHRLQPLEFIEGKPVAWSLGNFVWPRLSVPSATTAIAQVIVEPDGSIEACLVPTLIERSGHPVVQVELTGPCEWK